MAIKSNSRKEKLYNYILNNTGIDYILEAYETPDFIEFICKMGGDTITYRAYDKDGEITLYER